MASEASEVEVVFCGITLYLDPAERIPDVLFAHKMVYWWERERLRCSLCYDPPRGGVEEGRCLFLREGIICVIVIVGDGDLGIGKGEYTLGDVCLDD